MRRRNDQFTMDVTLEELGRDAVCVEAEITFAAYPGEPMVRYTRNGDGYPGSPPETEFLSVHVTEVSGETYDLRTREEMHGWHVDLERILTEQLYNEWEDEWHDRALEHAGEEEEAARDYAMDQKFERMREEQLMARHGRPYTN